MAGSNPGLHKPHRHMVSGVLAAASGIGLIVAAVCIVMNKMDAYEGPPRMGRQLTQSPHSL